MIAADDSSTRHFVVTSQGVSATRWLAFVLASHPEVFVAHGHFPVDSVVGGQFGLEKSKDDAAALSQGNAARDLYDSQGIGDVFAAYRSVKPGAAAYGAVHSYTLDVLMQQLESYGEAARVAVANLVRHPVSYIESHVSLVRKAERHPAVYSSYASDLFPKALDEYRELFLVDCPDFREFLAFAVSCYSALNVARDLGYEQFQHFRMETLTSDSSALDHFCRILTGLDYDPDQLRSFVAAGAINRHRKTSSSTEPSTIYRTWPAWKRDIAAVMISGQALARFEGAGYEVDMLRDGSYETERERTVVPCLADALRAMDERHPLLAPLSSGVTTARGPAYVAEPVLLESFEGYNILQVRTEFLALEQSLGAVDLTLDSQELIARHGAERVIVARTIEDARERVEVLAPGRPPAPRLLESLAGFNIVQFGTEFIAISHGVGEVHVTSGAQALIDQYGEASVFVTGSLEDARARARALANAPSKS